LESQDEEIPTDDDLSSIKPYKIDCYKVKKFIDEGQFGKVYVVFDNNEKKK